MTSYSGQVIWIVGASSGIGRALALELATRGAILAISARRADELEALKEIIGIQHRVYPLDITETDTVLRTAQAIRAAFGRIDRVIFLAGNYAPMNTNHLDMIVTAGIIQVNLFGAFNLAHAVLPILKAQERKGQIALCGSVAGYLGLPNGQPYSSTKAGIINLAESLYAEHSPEINIKLISPGFVRTPMTDKNNFVMPMMIDSEYAAKLIADGLLNKDFEIHFPKKFTYLVKFLRALPYALSLRMAAKFNK